jgi:hypothetical protein
MKYSIEKLKDNQLFSKLFSLIKINVNNNFRRINIFVLLNKNNFK